MPLSKIALLVSVGCLGIGLAGSGIATAWQEPAARVLVDSAAGQALARIDTKTTGFAVTCFALAPQGDIVALGSDDGNLRLWSLANGTVIRTIDTTKNGYI